MSSLESQIVPDDQHHDEHHDPDDPRPEPAPPPRGGGAPQRAVAALVGAASSAMAIAYITRASSTGGVLDWVFGLVLGAVGVSQLVSLVDSRTPLLVADGFGIRLRLGREWRGLPWDSLEQVVVEPRTSAAPRRAARRGAAAPEPCARGPRPQGAAPGRAEPEAVRRPARRAARHDHPGLHDDLVAELARLSQGRATVVEIAGYVAQPVVPDPPETVSRRERDPGVAPPAGGARHRRRTPVEGHEPRTPRLRGGLGTIVSRIGHGRAHDIDADQPGDLPATATATTPARHRHRHGNGRRRRRRRRARAGAP